MGLDARALRQQKAERSALNDSIDVMDTWVQSRIRAIMTGLPAPSPDMDDAGLQAYQEQLLQRVEEELSGLFWMADRKLTEAKAAAVDLGVAATGRLVEAELPSFEEVWRGTADADRAR